MIINVTDTIYSGGINKINDTIMKVNTLIILSFILLLSGCKTQQGKNTAERNPIDRFNSVIGLKKGDKIEKVYKIYGQPTEHNEHEDEYSFNTVHYYVDDPEGSPKWALSFSYEKDTHKIYTIRIRHDAPLLLRQKKIKDAIYIDVPADKLKQLFGPNDYVIPEILEYKSDGLDVEFNCYSFYGGKCYDYCIYWFN